MVLLRTLTKKSKLGFGKWKDYTVQELINLRKKEVLIAPYFKLTSINYTDDILKELGIIEGWIINKPSSDRQLYYEFLNSNGINKKVRGKGADKLKKERKLDSNDKLKNYNQGHK